MKIVYFYNGNKGSYILKKIIKLNFIDIIKIIVCDKKLIKKQTNKFLRKKYLFVKNINKINHKKFFYNTKPDLFIVAGYPQIFKKKIYNIPKIMTINLHGGPLPKYRGGSPLNWQIINQEKKIGISIIKVNKGIDTGDIINQKKFKFSKKDTIKTVHKKANKLFSSMLIKILKALDKNKVTLFKQKENGAKYWKQRKDSDGLLDFKKKTAKETDHFVRALTKPYPGAWIYLKKRNKKMIVRVYSLKILRKNFLKVAGEYKITNRKIFIKTLDKTCLISSHKHV